MVMHALHSHSRKNDQARHSLKVFRQVVVSKQDQANHPRKSSLGSFTLEPSILLSFPLRLPEFIFIKGFSGFLEYLC